MVGPARFLRACAASAVVVAGLAVTGAVTGASPASADTTGPGTSGTASGSGGPGSSGSVTSRPRDDAPLKVRIDSLAPDYLPATGDVEIRGTLTNRDDEEWRSITLYAFVGDEPLVNAAQLAKAAATPTDAVVGNRVGANPGDPARAHDDVDSLAPNAHARFTLRVPVSMINLSAPGVYWFGVHALGISDSHPSDKLADGRARTFLPFVPRRITRTVPTALVLPLTRRVNWSDDGSVADPATWYRSLTRGRLHDVTAFAHAAGARPLTWLVDPAVVDVVNRLAGGNAPRSAVGGRTEAADQAGSTPPSASVSGSPAAGTAAPSATPSSPTSPTSPSAAPTASASGAQGQSVPGDLVFSTATAWLQDFASVTAAGAGEDTATQVLRLPYGNLDVPAALRHAPDLLTAATAQKSTLDTLGVSSTAAFAAPGGYLDAASVAAADDDTVVLGTDKMFARPAPAVAEVDGRRVLVASLAAASGGPGPGPVRSAVSVRQRILAEAAVRVLKRTVQPLVVVLPGGRALRNPDAFFAGLDAPWLDLRTVADVADGVTPTEVAPSRLVYPDLQQRRELSPETFLAVSDLATAGATLQNTLTAKSDVATEAVRQALADASYASRGAQVGVRAAARDATTWIQDRLAAVQISAPRGVTLSGGAGKFAVTLTNNLDARVSVGVQARSDDGDLTIGDSRTVELDAGARTTVTLQARSATNRVHNVTLMVIDRNGTPIGATDEIPIRSAQVSNVIWVLMGGGAAILFGAIAMRLLRRIRAAGAAATAGSEAGAGAGPGPEPGVGHA